MLLYTVFTISLSPSMIMAVLIACSPSLFHLLSTIFACLLASAPLLDCEPMPLCCSPSAHFGWGQVPWGLTWLLTTTGCPNLIPLAVVAASSNWVVAAGQSFSLSLVTLQLELECHDLDVIVQDDCVTWQYCQHHYDSYGALPAVMVLEE